MSSIDTIRAEFAGQINGVDGRFHNVIANIDTKIVCNQTWVSESRTPKGKGYGPKYRMHVEIRFDDQCNNGHESFAITATINGPHGFDAGGCLHDDIARTFPELAPLIKWHLFDVNGPMHYVENTLYHASDCDHWGKRKGEPTSFDHVVRFGNSPVSHVVKRSFWDYLSKATTTDGHEWIIEKIEHPREPQTYGPKYTFADYCEKWHECPFDSYEVAQEWLTALTSVPIVFDKLPTLFSDGKPRDLAAARHCAVWPEATDDELCAPRHVLEKLLLGRLPGLVAEFHETMRNCGFILLRD